MKSFELESTAKSRPIVYVDMDGVLADFFGEVADAHNVDYWREIHRNDIGIDQIAKEPGFFANLDPLPNAGVLIKGVLKDAGKYSILSSPLMSQVEQSSREKAIWLNKHLSRHQPQGIIFDHDKTKFAKQADGTPNILIDDYKTNVRLWQAAGGYGIIYRDEEVERVLHELKLALAGKLQQEGKGLAVLEDDEEDINIPNEGKLYTSRQILKYVQGIHHEYHLEKPILKFKTWVLRQVPLSKLNTPEFAHQDDPYRRVIDLDWDHIRNIHKKDIFKKPVVADDQGWLLDGNHRVIAAKAAGLETVPALVPYNEN